ncbi:PAS domain-containing sensor histidine kinase [Flavobacterium sp. NG2]|uniref:PAS domain-containing sensor histidine kinase n=1 Tax=Flavobacterium sp. NG2 TaxID=3097547 RepID=UPI002A836F3A|nr:PAS domain-containing sensor histidine kinase [Flavobacterium sp. NG2]WPR70514.1 PAS domain-containing sensor histidine kinase [Flavobacterium sp. NG2]
MRMKRMMRIIKNTSNTNFYTEAKFEDFFNHSPDLLCVAGYDGYFKKINPAVSKLLEYTNEELLAKPINHFVYQEDKTTTISARNSIKDRNPLIDFENRYLTKSGRIVWLLWTSVPIENDRLIFAIAKNITYKKKLEEERNLHLAELTKLNTEFKQLTYTATHDLRSPVNNLISIFELLETDKIEDAETLEYLSIIKETTNNLKKTLNEYITVLDKKNKDNSLIEPLNFKIILEEVLLSISSFIQNSKTTINIDFSELEIINFNKTYLKSIFLNLITNSIKYSKPNNLPIISIYTTISDGKKKLIISDNGIGFDMKKVGSRIFGLHQKFNKNEDSNGIGLYLVNNHVTNLGGQITVESELNEGATFTITFKD